MCGSATFTIVVSSTCMKVADITAIVISARLFATVGMEKLLRRGDRARGRGRIHGYRRARTDAKRKVRIGCSDRDANRHALRDLHPIARRVLRWQGRESRPTRPADVLDASFEAAAAVHVDLDIDRLARADAFELRLL